MEWTKDRSLSNLAKGLDPAKSAGTTHPVADMIRWSSAGSKWEIYNGSTWVDLSASYAISVTGSAGLGLSGNGIVVRTAANTYTNRSLAQPAAGITISNADGTAGNPTFALANDLSGVEGLSTTGLATRTGDGTWTTRSLAQPAAGLTISNNTGVAGNPTFALANDLSALEGLGSTGIAVRSGSDTWVQRSVAGTANEITVTNGDGVAGNPTVSLPSAITLTGKTLSFGTYTNPAMTDQTLTFVGAGTTTWDTNSGQIATLTLTASTTTLGAPTNLKKGTYILHLLQDATGGRTMAWNAVFKWPLGTTPVLSTGANARDIFSFVCDGTNLYGAHLKGF